MFATRIDENAGRSMSAVGMAVWSGRKKWAAPILVGARRGVEKNASAVRWRCLATEQGRNLTRTATVLSATTHSLPRPPGTRRRSRPQNARFPSVACLLRGAVLSVRAHGAGPRDLRDGSAGSDPALERGCGVHHGFRVAGRGRPRAARNFHAGG